MKKNKSIHEKYVGKLTEVEWYDACQSKIDSSYLKSLNGQESGKQHLAINTTYGKIAGILKDVVIIIHEESTADKDGTDATVVPRGWIISPKDIKK